MKPMAFFAAIGTLGAFLGGCQVNPLGPGSAVQMPVLGYAGVQEINDGELLFSPTSLTVTNPRFPGGSLGFGSGGASRVYAGPSNMGNPNGTYGNGAAPLILGPTAWLCPGTCKDTAEYRGVGGVAGDFVSDYFVRYSGFKGPDASLDYSSMQLRFSGTGATEFDISAYRGVVFWARGYGNFAVSLSGRKPGDFITPASPDPAYSDWNFYLRRFGSELNGPVQWKEIIVYFSDMVQEYGLAVDLAKVKKKATGLQFDQQAPYTDHFRLDLDYIRLFK